MKLCVTAQTAQDLRAIEDYIGKDSPLAAVQFVQKLTDRFHELLLSPRIGRKCDELSPGLRSTRVGKYLIFYRAENANIVIVHVVHGSRNLPEMFYQEAVGKRPDGSV